MFIRTLPLKIIADLEQGDHAEAFFAATCADIRHGGNSARFSGASDHVQMPPFESFRSPESYYATLGHELVHWTKHEKRLDRDFGASAGTLKAMPARNWSPSLARRSCVLTLH